MIKILHSADWHLDAPMAGHSAEETKRLRQELRRIPEKIAALCKSEGCDLLLLAGDLFDGPYTKESMTALRTALMGLSIPVVISPGNHDFCSDESPYIQEEWPSNVHIFKKSEMEALAIPSLDCVIYGAGYTAMDCPALLKHFRAEGDAKWHIGVLHADATNASSPYCPTNKLQVQETALDYLALGHIHKAGSFRAGETLCAWPGCPMGHGFDETGDKGVIIATLDEDVQARFRALDTTRFYDEEIDVEDDPKKALELLLPSTDTSDFYRITLRGYSQGLELDALKTHFAHIPNLTLRDETQPEGDLWSGLDSDSLEGVYFSILHKNAQSDSETLSRRAKLAARISRRILDGQEVNLP